MTKKQLEKKIEDLELRILTQSKVRSLYGKGYFDGQKANKNLMDVTSIFPLISLLGTFTCDSCKEIINTKEEGIIEWKYDIEYNPLVGSLHVVHKLLPGVELDCTYKDFGGWIEIPRNLESIFFELLISVLSNTIAYKDFVNFMCEHFIGYEKLIPLFRYYNGMEDDEVISAKLISL